MDEPVLTMENLRVSAARGALTLTIESAVSASLISTFRTKFPSVAKYVEGALADYRATDKTDYDFNRLARELDEAVNSISEVSFTGISGMMVTVPQGFKGRYAPYMEFLAASGDSMIQRANRQLDEFYTVLARYVSSADFRGQSKDYTRAARELERDMEAVKTQLQSFFTNNVATVSTVGDTFDRIADIKDTVKLAKKVNASRNSIKTSSTIEIVDKISDTLALLMKTAESGDMPEVSKAMVNNVVEGAMVAARYVEFVAMLRFRMEEAVSALTQAVTKIKKAA